MRLALILACAATAASSQQLDLPEGCDGVLTIQNKSCLVTNLWTCEADAPGEQWLGLFGQPGMLQVRKIDEEFQWLETLSSFPPRIETMVKPAPDPESLGELFATEFDTYDFTLEMSDGAPSERIVGFDRLTGETTVIDGVELLNTEFGYEVLGPDGETVSRREGRQFVSEEFRIFILGESWPADEPDNIRDSSPVEFIFAGEPGFMSQSPKYECGVDTVSWEGQ